MAATSFSICREGEETGRQRDGSAELKAGVGDGGGDRHMKLPGGSANKRTRARAVERKWGKRREWGGPHMLAN